MEERWSILSLTKVLYKIYISYISATIICVSFLFILPKLTYIHKDHNNIVFEDASAVYNQVSDHARSASLPI